MLLSAVSVLVVAQSSSEIPEGLMNNPVYVVRQLRVNTTERCARIVMPCDLFTKLVYVFAGSLLHFLFLLFITHFL